MNANDPSEIEQHLPKIEQLLAAADALRWLAKRFLEMPEQEAQALQAAHICTTANLIAVELAHHLLEGADPYDALHRTAVGDLKLDGTQGTLDTILGATPKE